MIKSANENCIITWSERLD